MSVKNNDLFILGASDPEMEEIEKRVRGAGLPVLHAFFGHQRVQPCNAYRATGPSCETDRLVVCVECEVAGLDAAVRIDHHRPGDPGYGQPPEKYWEASSIGQVCQRLGIAPTKELRIIAAADHCLAAAYRGECPGVDPADLAQWRIASRAAFQRVDPLYLMEQVDRAKRILQKAPIIVIGDTKVADVRQYGVVKELPEAAAMTNTPFVAQTADKGGRQKLVIQAAPVNAVRAFIESWGPQQGLTEIYGDPQRGFAGGYLQ